MEEEGHDGSTKGALLQHFNAEIGFPDNLLISRQSMLIYISFQTREQRIDVIINALLVMMNVMITQKIRLMWRMIIQMNHSISQIPLESVDVVEGDKVQYNEYGDSEKKLGWIECIEIVVTEHVLDIGSLHYFGDDNHNERDDKLCLLKKAALEASHDVTDLELNDDRETRTKTRARKD